MKEQNGFNNGFVTISGFLPNDVVDNSGYFIELFGNYTGNKDEIIVITQLGRTVGAAYVCHLSSNGYYNCVFDLPDFPTLIIKQNICIQERDGVKYTMACVAEKKNDYAMANWLW